MVIFGLLNKFVKMIEERSLQIMTKIYFFCGLQKFNISGLSRWSNVLMCSVENQEK